MPGKHHAFPRASILVRPHRRARRSAAHAELVEAPGTAPGSAAAIAHGFYRHSRSPDEENISIPARSGKGQAGLVLS